MTTTSTKVLDGALGAQTQEFLLFSELSPEEKSRSDEYYEQQLSREGNPALQDDLDVREPRSSGTRIELDVYQQHKTSSVDDDHRSNSPSSTSSKSLSDSGSHESEPPLPPPDTQAFQDALRNIHRDESLENSAELEEAPDGVYVSAALPAAVEPQLPEAFEPVTYRPAELPEQLPLSRIIPSQGDTKRVSLPPSAGLGMSQATNSVMPASPLLQEVILILRRLSKLRIDLRKHRDLVEKARRTATRQRRRARLAQKRLLGAQINPQSQSVMAQADEAILRLYEDAKASTRQSRVSDESLAKAEKALQDIERRVTKAETNLQSNLEQLSLEDETLEDESDDFATSTYSSARSVSIDSLDDNPTVRAYSHMVGEIQILRDRLNEYEINHRNAYADREEAFEDMIVPAPKGFRDVQWHSSGAKSEFIRDHNLQNKSFLQDYFDTRKGMVEVLLATIEAARELRQRCLDHGQDPEDPDDPNAIEEILQYNLTGTIGTMYAVHHDGKHRGIMPISLIRVSYQHSDDRVEEWLREMRMANLNMTKEELDAEIDRPPPKRSFEIKYDVLKSTERRLNPVLTSATDFKPSHIMENEDEEKLFTPQGVVTILKDMRHWTAWAGEIYIEESEPDLCCAPLDLSRRTVGSADPLGSRGKKGAPQTTASRTRATSDAGGALIAYRQGIETPATDRAYIYRASREPENSEVTSTIL